MRLFAPLIFMLLAGSIAHAQNSESGQADTQRLRQELKEAFDQSQKYTLKLCEQMPGEFYDFRSTEATMTFSEQFRHCITFTTDQVAGRFGVNNPHRESPVPKVMTKEQVIGEVNKMYNFLRETIQSVPYEKLFLKQSYAGSEIPGWRLLYALENHLIHHRGQCIVYLRLKGITPAEGFLGW